MTRKKHQKKSKKKKVDTKLENLEVQPNCQNNSFVKTVLKHGDRISIGSDELYILFSFKAWIKEDDDSVSAFDSHDEVEHKMSEISKIKRFPKAMVSALYSMTEGETSKFEISPPHGIEDEELLKHLHLNSTVVYEITCVSVYELIDLSPFRDGGILFKKQHHSNLFPPCGYFVTVEVNYRMFAEGELIFDTYKDKPVTFVTYMLQVVPGLEIAVSHMKPGVVAGLCLSEKFAYGCNNPISHKMARREISSLLDDIDDSSAELWMHYSPNLVGKEVVFRDLIVVKAINSFSVWEYNEKEKHEQAKKVSGIGKHLFKSERYYAASIAFDKAMDLLEMSGGMATKEDLRIAEKMLVDVYNNLSITYFKRKDYKSTITFAHKAIEVPSASTLQKAKALYRMGASFLMLADFPNAREYLNAALELNGDDQLIRQRILQLGFEESEQFSRINKICNIYQHTRS